MSAVAVLAAVALSFSIGASGVNSADAIARKRAATIAVRNTARSGDNARLGAALAAQNKVASRGVVRSNVTHRATGKIPVLLDGGGYIAISACGDDLGESDPGCDLPGRAPER